MYLFPRSRRFDPPITKLLYWKNNRNALQEKTTEMVYKGVEDHQNGDVLLTWENWINRSTNDVALCAESTKKNGVVLLVLVLKIL